MEPLTDEQKAMLDLAAAFYVHPGARDADARERFGLSPTKFWQKVNYVLDLPAAMEHDAVTVKRLRRLRDVRRGQRSARVRLG